MTFEEFDVPTSHCPKCSSANDRASTESRTAPRAGDVSVCACCGEILEYDQRLRLIPISDGKRAAAQAHGLWPQILRYQAAAKRCKARREN